MTHLLRVYDALTGKFTDNQYEFEDRDAAFDFLEQQHENPDWSFSNVDRARPTHISDNGKIIVNVREQR